MKSRILIPLISLGTLIVVGAACTKKPATQPSNSNVSTNTMINTNSNSNTTTPVPDQTNTSATNSSATPTLPLFGNVSITSDGFSPETVKVRVGGTVTWTNDDTAQHQPASDPHPAHTNVPGFDSRSGLGQGETYAFTFIKSGTFTYHDHLFSSKRGTVIVE